MKRRSLLKLAGAAGAGLVVGWPLSACRPFGEDQPQSVDGAVQFNAFIQITPTNEIHFYQPRAEMGQGVTTGLTTLVAEALGVAPGNIVVHRVGVDAAYRLPDQPIQLTGGSTSMKGSYEQILMAAALAKAAIRDAAAVQLQAAPEALQLMDGQVWHAQASYPYGDFVTAAANRPLPDPSQVILPTTQRYIGQTSVNHDGLEKSTGTAQYGIDVRVPNQHVAVVVRSPVAGGRVKAFDASRALEQPGVVRAVQLPHGVAVVAKTYWRAKQAAALLTIEWDQPTLAAHTSDTMREEMAVAMARDDGQAADGKGDVKAALAAAAKTLRADYWAPHLAHATMEPMTCTVTVDPAAGTGAVWVGSQIPDLARQVAAHHLDLPADKVTIHATYLGGGFGRRLYTDFVAEAAQVCRATGLPIQLIWSREDDIRHDFYRPSALMAYQGGLDASGAVVGLSAKRVGADAFAHFLDASGEAMLSPYVGWTAASWLSERGYGVFKRLTVDSSSVEGLTGGYVVPNQSIHHVSVDHGVPVGFWRSVGHAFSAFGAESFMDELAHLAGRDPVEFRLAHLGDDERLKAVLTRAATEAGWGQPAPGRFLGIAAHRSFETCVAQVVEVSVVDKQVTVHRITCAVDCGLAVTPDVVRQQISGGALFGLTAALYGEITFRDGVVQQSNFHDYPLLRMSEAPTVSVHIIDSPELPTGVGEPGVPPVAPALANAIFAATGQRLRSLPLKL